MLMNYKKIIIKCSFFCIIAFFIFIWFSNKFFGGPPLYGRFLISPYQDTLRIYYKNYYDLNKEYKFSKQKKYNKNLYMYNCRENKKKFIVYSLDKNNFKNNFNSYKINNILIGDSVLFGNCVDYENSITELLRNKTGDSFLELSQPGTTIDTQSYWLTKFVNQNNNFQNLIIFFYEGDDLAFSKNYKISKRLIGKKLSIINIKKTEEKYKNDLDQKININQKIRFILAENLSGISSFIKHIIFYKKVNNEKKTIKYFSYINDLKKYYNMNKPKNIYIVYLPAWERFQYPAWHNKYKYYDSIFDQLKSYSLETDVNLIDCRKSIGNNKELIFPQRYFQHYNELGYLKIANCYLDNIR